ncbi:MAG: hypothetical protein ABSG13_26730 [Bryobacteraceae bacterium]|jgi:hypothetical protein
MALGRAITGLIADWSAVLGKAFEGFWAKALQAVLSLAFLVAIFSAPHLIWPKMDVKMSNTQMSRDDGRLTLVSFDLANASYLDLKDPEVACDMKGESGTAIKTVSKVIYEVLPSERKRSFLDVEMGAIPEQVAYFNCYVSGASVKW